MPESPPRRLRVWQGVEPYVMVRDPETDEALHHPLPKQAKVLVSPWEGRDGYSYRFSQRGRGARAAWAIEVRTDKGWRAVRIGQVGQVEPDTFLAALVALVSRTRGLGRER